MTEKELRRLSRADLLDMLIEQSEEMEALRGRMQSLEKILQSRSMIMEQAGSIAQAALQINGIFEAAQAACDQYTENVRKMQQHQEELCRQREHDSVEWAMELMEDTERKCAELETKTREKCEKMLFDARQEAKRYWSAAYQKIEALGAMHEGIKAWIDIDSLRLEDTGVTADKKRGGNSTENTGREEHEQQKETGSTGHQSAEGGVETGKI